jgi:hypothetical protein
MYSSTLSLTSALEGVGGQRHTPAALPLGMTRYLLYKRLGGPQCWSGWVRKISPPPGFESRNVEPAASRYTDYAIPDARTVTGSVLKLMGLGFLTIDVSLLLWP